MMHSQVCPYPETLFTMPATHSDNFFADPFVPFMFEDPIFGGDIAYEYLAREASRAPGSQFSDWPAYSPSISCAYPGFAVNPIPIDNPLFFPASSSSPEPPSPGHGRQPPPKPSCSEGAPSFNDAQEKWTCSVCRDAFRNKYECNRHIGNVGKQVVCLACRKTLGARKDNRKRHYTKYCKRMDLGRDGDLSLEDAFVEV